MKDKVLEVQYWLCITGPSFQTLPYYHIPRSATREGGKLALAKFR